MRGKPAPPVNPDRFMRSPAGYSLTQPKGKWAWEKPPKHVDPDEVVSKIIDNLETDYKLEKIVKLMYAGVSIQEIVNTIGMAGFTEGQFTPDVAELIKPPIAIYLLGVAEDYDIPVKFYANEKKQMRKKESLEDGALLEIMRMRNPDFADFIENSYYDEEAVQEAETAMKRTQGFLAVKDNGMEEDNETI